MSTIKITSTAPREGSPLPADEYVAVYGEDSKFGTEDIKDGAITNPKLGAAAVKSHNIDWATIPHIVAVGRIVIKGAETTNAGTTVDVEIPEQPDANYFVFLSRHGGTAYQELHAVAFPVNTTSFRISQWRVGTNNSSTCTWNWMVIRQG